MSAQMVSRSASVASRIGISLPDRSVRRVRDESLLPVLHDAATAVRRALDGLADWGLAGTAKAGQYRTDLVADRACLEVLTKAGLGVLSEESGATALDREVIVVV